MAVKLLHEAEPVYKFKDAARVPEGATPEGIMDERERIIGMYGHATVRNSASAALKAPDQFPNLRAFGPVSAEHAMQLAMEEGVRKAYQSVVEIVTEVPDKGKKRTVELRVLHAVPMSGVDGLVYEPMDVIWESPEQKSYLIRKLRDDARSFTQRLETTLAELEYWDR